MNTASTRIIVCCMLLTSLFIGAVKLPLHVEAEQGAPYDTGLGYWQTDADWWIQSGDTVAHENKTIVVNGDLIVNGSLTLTNVTLKMANATYDGEYGITVLENGTLTIQDYDDDKDTTSDASVVESNTSFRFDFEATPGSKLELKNSRLSDCGWSSSIYINEHGLFINTNWANVTGTIINDSYCGAIIYECNNVTLANNTVYDIEHDGVYTQDAVDCYLQNNSFYNIQDRVIFLYSSVSINLSYNDISDNPSAFGILVRGDGAHEIYNNTLYNNAIGIFLYGNGSTETTALCLINENDISGNSDGIYIRGLDGADAIQYIEIYDNDIYSNSNGIFVIGQNAMWAIHDLYIYGNEIYSNTNYGIHLRGENGPVLAINTIFIYNNTVRNNGGSGGHGIYFLDTTSFSNVAAIYCYNNEVRDNVYGGTAAGYYIESASYIFIEDDYIARNNRNVWVRSSDNIYITNSTIEKRAAGGSLDLYLQDPWGNPPSVYLLNTTFNKAYA
ncbi:MAG: right-handed parallel beta-helix repeat-containing protein, partial [Methanomassiliicoccales archaeon]